MSSPFQIRALIESLEDLAYFDAIDDIIRDMKSFQQIESLIHGCPNLDRYSSKDNELIDVQIGDKMDESETDPEEGD